MHPAVPHLIELQRLDHLIAGLRAELEAFPKRLREADAKLSGARAAVVAAKEAHVNSQKERKKFELDVEQWKDRARKYRDQSGAVKTNEAYKALQHEIANAEAEIAKAEDRLLERMVAGEDYERQVKAAERAVKEVETAAQADRLAIEAEQAAAQKELEADIAERERAVATIPEDLLDHYQRIARRHNGVALAEVRDETCMLCRVRVRPHVYQELRRETSHEIFHCESCTRILYYTDQPVAQAPMAQTSEG